MATKRQKRSEVRTQIQEEYEPKQKKKEIMDKGEKIKWLLAGIALLCMWILTKFSA